MKDTEDKKKKAELPLDLEPFIKAVLARKAENVVALDVSALTSYADVLIVCSGRSSRQVGSIAESVKVDLKKVGKSPLNIDGAKEGLWVLMDYGHVVIHVFFHETRDHYDIEGLWSDAVSFDIDYLNVSDNDQ